MGSCSSSTASSENETLVYNTETNFSDLSTPQDDSEIFNPCLNCKMPSV